LDIIYTNNIYGVHHISKTLLDKSREQDAGWIAAMMEELSNIGLGHLYPYLLKNKPYHSNGSPQPIPTTWPGRKEDGLTCCQGLPANERM
jgi:hypothetical protein